MLPLGKREPFIGAQKRVCVACQQDPVMAGRVESIAHLKGESKNHVFFHNFPVLRTAVAAECFLARREAQRSLQLANTGDKTDADNLASGLWREKIEKSIVGALDKYFSEQLARLPGGLFTRLCPPELWTAIGQVTLANLRVYIRPFHSQIERPPRSSTALIAAPSSACLLLRDENADSG